MTDNESEGEALSVRCWISLLLLPIFGLLALDPAMAVDLDGIKVNWLHYSGPAKLSVKATGKHKLTIDVDPQTERKRQAFQVEFPIAGPNAWPIADLEVLDSRRRPVPVRRGGIEWHKLSIMVPPERNTFFVHAIDPTGDRPQIRPERQRHATDPKTGLSAAICKWYGGRRTALSIRFDDSHPTHLNKVIPMLNEYGFRGTFMVNPGGHPPNSRRRSAFESHRAEWEAVARRGNHEFANHTMNHWGAQNDDSMEHEIGDSAAILWGMFPNKSKLLALNLGGGTEWVTTRTLRYYLDKYHLFDASSNSTGMDDVYGNRIAKLRQMLEASIHSGVRCKIHYHAIGNGFGTSEANFRAAMGIIKERQDELWIAGMADIHKYEVERLGASLSIENKSQRRVRLKLACTTKPELYDQLLTVDVTLPESWEPNNVVITDRNANQIGARIIATSDSVVLRFDAEPTDAKYTFENTNFPEHEAERTSIED